MTPRVASVVAFVALIGSLATPLYDPLTTGEDDSWALFLLVGAVGVGLGAGTRHAAALLAIPPMALAVAVSTEAHVGVFLVLLPALVCATLAGFLAGQLHPWLISAAAFVVACVPVAYAVSEQLERGERLPRAVEATLPLDESLADICVGPRTRSARLERQADALVVLVRERPDDLAGFLYTSADQAPERKLITVREVAEEQLYDLTSGFSSCTDRATIRALRHALDG